MKVPDGYRKTMMDNTTGYRAWNPVPNSNHLDNGRYGTYRDAVEAASQPFSGAIITAEQKSGTIDYDELKELSKHYAELETNAKDTAETELTDEQVLLLIDILTSWNNLRMEDRASNLKSIQEIMLKRRYTNEQKIILNKVRKSYKEYINEKEEIKPIDTASNLPLHGYKNKTDFMTAMQQAMGISPELMGNPKKQKPLKWT